MTGCGARPGGTGRHRRALGGARGFPPRTHRGESGAHASLRVRGAAAPRGPATGRAPEVSLEKQVNI